MKYFKTLKVYKASNVQLNAETLEATSYDWWTFQKKIGKFLVFNTYNYSNSTCKHQSKVRQLNNNLGVTPDLYLEVSEGLQGKACFNTAVMEYQNRIKGIQAAISKKGSRKSTNAEREQQIEQYKVCIQQCKMLDKEYNK